MGAIYTTETLLRTVNCYACGLLFAFPADTMERREFDGKSFWCPCCGKSQCFCGTDKQRLENEVARMRAANDQVRAEVDRQRKIRMGVERKLRAQKGVTTRIKNRVKNGVCPCCHRHFENLERHMQGKHPEFATDD